MYMCIRHGYIAYKSRKHRIHVRHVRIHTYLRMCGCGAVSATNLLVDWWHWGRGVCKNKLKAGGSKQTRERAREGGREGGGDQGRVDEPRAGFPTCVCGTLPRVSAAAAAVAAAGAAAAAAAAGAAAPATMGSPIPSSAKSTVALTFLGFEELPNARAVTVANTDAEFAEAVAKLYTDADHWLEGKQQQMRWASARKSQYEESFQQFCAALGAKRRCDQPSSPR